MRLRYILYNVKILIGLQTKHTFLQNMATLNTYKNAPKMKIDKYLLECLQYIKKKQLQTCYGIK